MGGKKHGSLAPPPPAGAPPPPGMAMPSFGAPPPHPGMMLLMKKEKEKDSEEKSLRRNLDVRPNDIFETEFKDLQELRKEQVLPFKEIDSTKEYGETQYFQTKQRSESLNIIQDS
mmetsp:Transcript_22168/g.16564  ORF Transcript_22168/g.16564 Transcript_22168/m.16564 type:complete len:115 (+) Transcript_22168:84-428(+)